MNRNSPEFEVLVLAPTGSDGPAAVTVLGDHKMAARTFPTLDALCERLKTPAGAVLIAEEALTLESSDKLKRVLSFQEPWSSIPIILMTSEFEKILSVEKIMEILGTSGSLSILERPFKILTLISALRVALGARQKQYEVRELLREQVQALKQRDEFLSIASHELKTPLTSLKIQVQIRRRLLEKKDDSVFSPEKVTGLVGIAEKQIDRLIRLVDDMLDITRIQNGKLSLNIQPVEFDLLAKEVVENFSDEFERAGCELSFTSQDRLMIEGDRYRLEQVIANLLSNALKYGNKAPVSVSARLNGSNVELSVKDQGMGISLLNQERIFDRFERAVNPNNIGGLGLGLYITRQIVELHSGQIRVKSLEGQGSEFLLELPAKN